MRFEKDRISGSYDERHDVLYIYYKGREHSYGTEDPDGIVCFKAINSDEVSGYVLYDFKKKSASGELDISTLEYEFKVAVNKLINEL